VIGSWVVNGVQYPIEQKERDQIYNQYLETQKLRYDPYAVLGSEEERLSLRQKVQRHRMLERQRQESEREAKREEEGAEEEQVEEEEEALIDKRKTQRRDSQLGSPPSTPSEGPTKKKAKTKEESKGFTLIVIKQINSYDSTKQWQTLQ